MEVDLYRIIGMKEAELLATRDERDRLKKLLEEMKKPDPKKVK